MCVSVYSANKIIKCFAALAVYVGFGTQKTTTTKNLLLIFLHYDIKLFNFKCWLLREPEVMWSLTSTLAKKEQQLWCCDVHVDVHTRARDQDKIDKKQST